MAASAPPWPVAAHNRHPKAEGASLVGCRTWDACLAVEAVGLDTDAGVVAGLAVSRCLSCACGEGRGGSRGQSGRLLWRIHRLHRR